ncbi:MAG: sugar phosphate isomerase/epimerase family protein [Armatimonadota bacterium]
MEQEDQSYSRRELMKKAAGSAAAVTGLAAAAAVPRESTAAAQAVKPGRPKIGCVSWCFHGFEGGADPTESIRIMGELGFEGTDLILNAREDITDFWTDAKIGELRRLLDRHKMEVAQFVIFQPVVEGLTSTNRDERERNLDYFEAGVKIGKKLGAPIVDIVAPWARELNPPGGGYLPRYYDLPNPQPGQKFHIEIAPGFDWDALWAAYVQTTKDCLARAKAHGLKLTIEHHTHTMIPDAVSFLRLWDAIKDPALGYNLDTGWTLSQREYPPVAIHKTKKQLMNLHVRDIDGMMRSFIHVGDGVMDFKAVVDTLKQVGYNGFMSIEQDKWPGDMKATCARYLAMMKEYRG